MRRRPIRLLEFTVLAATVASFATVFAASSQRNVAADLLSEDQAVRRQAVEALLAQRKEVVTALIDIIETKANLTERPGSVRAAVELLGAMRAVEAVDPLVDIISFSNARLAGAGHKSLRSSQRLPGLWWERPLQGTTAHALIEIGQPCIPAVINKIAKTDDLVELKACLKVLVHLRRWTDVADLLHEAVVEETDQARIRRLQNALAALANMPADDRLPRRIEQILHRAVDGPLPLP